MLRNTLINQIGQTMADKAFEIISTLVSLFLGFVVWVYNRDLKQNDKEIVDMKIRIEGVEKTNKEIKDNYILRFESLQQSQNDNTINILKALNQLSDKLTAKIEETNKEIKKDLAEKVSNEIASAIKSCRIQQLEKGVENV